MSLNTITVCAIFGAVIVATLLVALIVVRRAFRPAGPVSSGSGGAPSSYHDRTVRPQPWRDYTVPPTAPAPAPAGVGEAPDLTDQDVVDAIFAELATEPGMDDLTRKYARILAGVPDSEETQ